MITIEQICHSDDFFIVVNNKIVCGLIYGRDVAEVGEEALLDIVRESIVAATGEEDVPIVVIDWTDKICDKMNQAKTTRYQALQLLLAERVFISI
jgi:hypothetical protein